MKDTIGRYRVEKKIGEGAMGIVYLAYDSMIDRRVAIKSLRLERLKNQNEAGRIRNLFFHEAKIIGKLNHSHITAIYDMGQENGNPYLVMEYVNGKTIKELIKSGEPFPLGEKLTLLAMVARALHYAHQRGVIHRDIKPANIMILVNNTPKVMDFGIAAVREHTRGDGGNIADTEDGIILGTPGYMSPEQVLAKELDQRSDIFSLGILAHEWIGGKKPFKGRNLKEVLTAVISKPAGSLKKICGADEELCRIVDKALAKKRKERYRSAEQFSDAIELYLSKIEKEKSGAGASLSYNSIRVIERLRKNYLFFSDFTDEELFDIFKLSGKEKYKKGDVIIQEGTSGAKMYIIIRGSVVIEKETNGQKLEVNRLEEGGCFGEMAIIDKMPRSASAVAAEKTAVIAINEIVLRETNPQLCLKLYRNLAAMISEKLRLSDSKYMDIVSKMKNGAQT
jgi:serine/threonine-protein kinase